MSSRSNDVGPRSIDQDSLRRYAARQELRTSPQDLVVEEARVRALLELIGELDTLRTEPNTQGPPPAAASWHEPTTSEDPHNAIITVCDVKRTDTGPLAGLRVGVKDNIAVAGVPLTFGHLPREFVPTQNALAVESLLDAGGHIVAKTNLVLMERPEYGHTSNPVNERYLAGASSSGSAAAVAAGQVDVALGVDQGGSIRNPAATCGIVGLKPTAGVVPLDGVEHWDLSMDCVGPMTRDVQSNLLVFRQLVRDTAGQPPGATSLAGQRFPDVGQSVAGMRVGVLVEARPPTAYAQASLPAWLASQERLRHLGMSVEPVSLPLWSHSISVWVATMCAALPITAEFFGQSLVHGQPVDEEMLENAAHRYQDEGRRLPPFPF